MTVSAVRRVLCPRKTLRIVFVAVCCFWFAAGQGFGEGPEGVVVPGVVSLAMALPGAVATGTAGLNTNTPASPCELSPQGSPYIPLDYWLYPALLRLYSLGYLDTAFLGLRPWTRLSVVHMLEETSAKLEDAPDTAANDEARSLYDALWHELNIDAEGPCRQHHGYVRLESAYSNERGISGTPLHDSFHIGQSVVNDFGRPIESGFNDYSGGSGYAVAGPFTLYARTEVQYAPSATGYSYALYSLLSEVDQVPPVGNEAQATIPLGPIGTKADVRLVEGYISAHVLGHDLSFGKQDQWWGPGRGGAYAFSNNAQNIYTFEINRSEPLHVPLLSRLTGPFRYEFLVGSLKGHTYFNEPWVHAEKISFKPTRNLEVGFQRTAIWGGKGHVPITLGSFLTSFFSVQNVSFAVKTSRSDPGARFGAFDVSYRLPFLRNWLTFYTDSEAHDDVSPISDPVRSMFRPGLYLSHVPAAPKLDIRVEGILDDPNTPYSQGGGFQYWEYEVRQGYTNSGQIFGDWMGREAKGGQAWTTWHFNAKEWMTVNWRRQKQAKDFISGGTTLDDFGVQLVKRFGKDLELNANFTYEGYKAPIYLPGQQNVTVTTIQLTWFPTRKVSF